MFRGRTIICVLLAALAVFLLYLYNLNGAGLLGPDEPRYASIGREMARSGDWITPRLWGESWFEKPPLLYWMTAVGFKSGLSGDLGPRLPVALLAVIFLAFFYVVICHEFGARAALLATAALGASAGWIAYARVAVPDLPLAATFGVAVLLVLPWLDRGATRPLPWAAALLGLAVLAKGLVPLVLALPVLWVGRRRWRDLVRPLPILVFFVVAAPWYVIMTARHGRAFLDVFFVQHQFARISSDALQHVQPFWFYVPVFLAALFPWTPLIGGMFRTEGDARRRALLALVLFGLVFFSAARNKLPGYVLPLLPPAAALIGVSLAKAARARWTPAASVVLLGGLPAVAAILPEALLHGITHTAVPVSAWFGLAPAVAAAAVVTLAPAPSRPRLAVILIVAGMAGGVFWMARTTLPVLDEKVSARAFARKLAGRQQLACIGSAQRSWRYGLNYYTETPLPDCGDEPRPLRIDQDPKDGPRISRE